jgi:ATP-dependent protease HslVU (ClpYQ) peptidase subunit
VTVIAYRDGIMAGDSCWSNGKGHIISIASKIIRLKHGILYGGAGGADDREIVKKLFHIERPDQIPNAKWFSDECGDKECAALLAFPEGEVWIVSTEDGDEGAHPIKAPFASIGSGRHLAAGAMASGANAEQAVWVACQYNVYCRPPVQVIGFHVTEYIKHAS